MNGLEMEDDREHKKIESGKLEMNKVCNHSKNIEVKKKEMDKSFDNQDPFILHFSKNMSKNKGSEIQDYSRWKTSFTNWPVLQQIVVEVPTVEPVKPKKRKLFEEEEDTDLPPIGVIPHTPSKASKTVPEFLHKRLVNNINPKSFSSFQSEILTIISQYIDFHYPYATHEKWDKIRTVYCIHCLNHILKTRKQITTHNNKLEELKNETSNIVYLDQGFTRPKVLILLPFKHSAYKVIKKMMSLFDVEVKNKKRFEREFGPPDDDDKSKKRLDRPEDFHKTFEGDIGEDFKIGLRVTKKSLKLYSEFFQSDIIIASPLGLRYSLEVAEGSKKDFLSSIEVLVMDQADFFMMQNWEHILIIRDAINKMPGKLQEVVEDLCRVRRWCFDVLSPHYRQTIIFSTTLMAYNQYFMAKMRNFAGKMQVLNVAESGSIDDVTERAELILQRVNPSGNGSSPDAQFAHFTQQILPLLRRKKQSHTLIYVPDYCDYIRLVRYFKEDGGTSVATINEYMMEENSKVAKARSLFFEGKRTFLIYTERFHFYRRYKIKGIQHIVFYELPTFPHFFSEICNFMADEYQNPREPTLLEPHTILVPFQYPDASKLVGLFGNRKAEQIYTSDKLIHKCDIGN